MSANSKSNPALASECDDVSVRSISSEDSSQAPWGYCCAKSINPAAGKGRKFHLIKMLVLPFIPICALIVQTSFNLNSIMRDRNEVLEVENQVTIATELGKVVTRMQLERSEVAFYVYTNGDHYLRTNLEKRFELTNEALKNMNSWPSVIIQYEGQKKLYLNKSTFQHDLTKFRDNLIKSEESSITDVLTWYTSVNAAMLEHLTTQIKETDSSGVWRYLLAFKNLLKSIESTGIASVYGVNYFGKGYLKQSNYIGYITHDAIAKDLLNSSLNYVPQMKKEYQALARNMPSYGKIKHKNDIILKNITREPNYKEALEYFDSMAIYTDELRKIQRTLRVIIKNYVNENLQDAASKEALFIGIFVVVLAVSPVIIWLVRNAVEMIQLYAANLAKKAKELKREKRKSDLLLFQMLPPSVAMQLKQTRQVPAEYYASVTVYFSDIVGFTEIAAVSTPLEVVTFLNKIYKQFDARIECYDVYKVETIGDSYMVASGLPVKNGNRHVTEIASMALDLLAGSRQFKIPHRKSERLRIRSGAHTGPVVAASKIHISLDMKNALDAIGGYKTEHRGLVDVKGKGLMDTYWLTCKEGVPNVSIEIETPTHFPEDEDTEPVFIKRLRNENYF
ncbi:hypothetical protein NQ315_001644 [Exocentrus adspersus]|uniref:guanylate cyclase n=1 Tax=Exocentrus adspersus TaxID=1586481 RepID=A0AAV8WA86_9CUCU|nr:hypothetical protein NQ315_001644 [Exocentrus adspersus]